MVVPAKSLQSYDTSSDMISGVQMVVGYNNQFDFDLYGSYDEWQPELEGYANELQVAESRIFPRLLENSNITDTTSGVLELERINEIISPECTNFCNSHSLVETFNRCLQKIKDVFKDATKIEAELNCFCDEEEIEEEPHVSIEVTLNATWETAESYYEEWLSWFVENVSDSIRKYFILTTNRE